MSESSREKAGQVKEQLYWARWHTERAREIVKGVPDAGLQRKVDDAHQRTSEAHEHVKKGFEQK